MLANNSNNFKINCQTLLFMTMTSKKILKFIQK